jgi:hypothetical protein
MGCCRGGGRGGGGEEEEEEEEEEICAQNFSGTDRKDFAFDRMCLIRYGCGTWSLVLSKSNE